MPSPRSTLRRSAFRKVYRLSIHGLDPAQRADSVVQVGADEHVAM